MERTFIEQDLAGPHSHSLGGLGELGMKMMALRFGGRYFVIDAA